MLERALVMLAICLPLSSSAASSSRDGEIASQLRFFRDHTKEAMQTVPVKRDTRTGAVVHSKFFTADEIANRDFVIHKDRWREAQVRFAAPGAKDRPEAILDNPHLMAKTLVEMEAAGRMTAAAAVAPWSGDYWGHFRGLLAKRYADPGFPESYDWKRNFDYVMAPGRTFGEIAKSGDLARINQLSPAEKYDLVIGAPSGLLTNQMWAAGKEIYDRDGKVEDWVGICQGWTSASYMQPRPSHTVDVMAADGRTLVTFYPHDVKALASLLWAWGKIQVKGYLGSRCRLKDPPMDANGRVLDEECFNTNPAAWHEAIVHQLGFEKKSVAMDAIYDYEVWNQPIRSYTYTYFNPKTLKPAATLTGATVALTAFATDKFKKYRSPQAVKVVGIAMDLTYVAEQENPLPETTDSEANDIPTSVRYLYDLELDASGTIVGGEWYQNAHPDFLWRPVTGSSAVSNYESMVLSTWDSATPLPADWQSAAQAAAQDRVPLGRIVQILVQKSR